jgi:hypothetical protein
MRVHVTDPAVLPDLLEFFRSRPDAVVTQIAEDELEVSLLGSLAQEAMRMELYLRIRLWEAKRRAMGAVELVDES